MTKGDLEGLAFLGRPIKPVAFAIALNMIILLVVNLNDTGRLGDAAVGDVVAVSSALSAFLLMGAWWGKWQRWAEYGLLAAMFTYIARGTFVALLDWPNQSLFFSFTAAIIAGGSFLLERHDSHTNQARVLRGTNE